MYGNEAGVGAAINTLPRGDVYVTTKLANDAHEPAVAKASLEESLDKLGLDHVDLFLIHWPLPMLYGGDFVSTWEALIELQQAGLTTSIGVSNFRPQDLSLIVERTGVAPVVNQIEVHPYFTNDVARAASLRVGALVQGWSPLAQGTVAADPVVTAVAETYGKSASQVVLRWHIERGDIVFPKSTRRERLVENLDIFDFELAPADVEAISALDRGEAGRMGPHPDTFGGAK
jgi:2,5-diketo-D-gluconate reductase A